MTEVTECNDDRGRRGDGQKGGERRKSLNSAFYTPATSLTQTLCTEGQSRSLNQKNTSLFPPQCEPMEAAASFNNLQHHLWRAVISWEEKKEENMLFGFNYKEELLGCTVVCHAGDAQWHRFVMVVCSVFSPNHHCVLMMEPAWLWTSVFELIRRCWFSDRAPFQPLRQGYYLFTFNSRKYFKYNVKVLVHLPEFFNFLLLYTST